MIHEYGVTTTIRHLGRLAIGFLQIKIAGDFFDHLFRNDFGVFNERADQGMFTKQIDNPRNASGMAMHNFDRRWAEDLPSRVAGDAEPLLDVAMRLEQRQRACFGPESNALAKLPQARVVYFFLQLRLTGEHNLQEFFRGSLQIRQKPNLFEHVRRQVLRFVDD